MTVQVPEVLGLHMNDSELVSDQTLEQLACNGDPGALGILLQRSRERLERSVRFRMDRRIVGRIDAADVVQDSFVDAVERFGEFCDQDVAFFVWLRFITMQRLTTLHRRHLGAQARNAAREVSIYGGPMPEATSADLAARLLGRLTSPSQAVSKMELKIRLQESLAEMETTDREVLALRYFEQLTNSETAKVLDISDSAASNRYVRALKRLRTLMDTKL